MKYTIKMLTEVITQSYSKAEVLRCLGLVPAGGNYKTLNKLIKELSLDTSHFTGQAWNTGDRYRKVKECRKLDDVLVEHSTYYSTHNLRLRLIKEGVKEAKCEWCGITKWNKQPAPLELDHVNGVNDDNRLENLRILCPNCHAQTNTYRGRHKKKNKTQKTVEDRTKRVRTDETLHKCNNCSKIMERKAKSGYCNSCVGLIHKRFSISKEELEKLVWEMPTSKVARIFQVSDVAIAKRCKKLGVAKPPRGYWSKKRHTII